MKLTITAFLISVFLLSIKAQTFKLDSIYILQIDVSTGDSILSDVVSYEYNESNQITKRLGVFYSDSIESRTEYEYNENNQIIKETNFYSSVDFLEFISSEKIFVYDLDGLLDSMYHNKIVFEYSDSSSSEPELILFPSERTAYFYNNNGTLSQEYVDSYDRTYSVFVNDRSATYYYGERDLLDSIVTVSWSTESGLWSGNASSIESFTYDDFGEEISNLNLTVQTWDDSGNPTSFSNGTMVESEYDSSGRLASSINSVFDFDVQDWIPNLKNNYYYEDLVDNVSYERYEWDVLGGVWVKTLTSEVIFFDIDLFEVLVVDDLEFPDFEFFPFASLEYIYDSTASEWIQTQYTGFSISPNIVSGVSSSNDQVEKSISYPNPVIHNVTFSSINEIETLIIFNSLGEKVFEISGYNENELTIDLATFKSGVYSFKMNDTDGLHAGKFIKD